MRVFGGRTPVCGGTTLYVTTRSNFSKNKNVEKNEWMRLADGLID
jgi:hypothetical protein